MPRARPDSTVTPAPTEEPRHPLGPAETVRGRLACPDDRHGERVVGAQRTPVEQERGEVVDRPQVDRVVVVEDGGELDAVRLGALEHHLHGVLALVNVITRAGQRREALGGVAALLRRAPRASRSMPSGRWASRARKYQDTPGTRHMARRST